MALIDVYDRQGNFLKTIWIKDWVGGILNKKYSKLFPVSEGTLMKMVEEVTNSYGSCEWSHAKLHEEE